MQKLKVPIWQSILLTLLFAFVSSDHAHANTQDLKSMALSGDTQAMIELGSIYLYGDGERQNNREAAKWFRMAAVRRHFEGAYGMGAVYLNEEDFVTAYTWFALYANEDEGLREASNEVYQLLSEWDRNEALAEAAKLRDRISKEQEALRRQYVNGATRM